MLRAVPRIHIRPVLARGLALLRRSWLLLGLVLLWVAAIELASSVVLTTAYQVLRAGTAEIRDRADAYGGADWARAYYDEYAKCGRLRWTSYVYWRRLPCEGAYINVAGDGRRRTWRPEGTPTATVWAFGGSTMWGTGARDDHTIPSLVARQLLERSGIRAAVTNFGESGYVSTQELITLEIALRSGERPDVVIFYDGVNDAFSAYQQRRAGIPENESNRAAEFNILRPDQRARLVGGLVGPTAIRETATYQLVDAIMKRLPFRRGTEAGAFDARLAGEAVAAYRENLRVVVALGRTYGFEPLFYWQPMIFHKERLTGFEMARRDDVAYFGPMVRAVDAAIASDAGLRAMPQFADLSGVFRDVHEPVFVDYAHLGESGNAAIADRISIDIARALAPRR